MQRAKGRGPAFTRKGNRVFYSLKSILETERRRDAGLHDDKLLRLTDVIDLTGLSRATLLRWEQDGRFPAGIRLSRGCVRWSARQVERWIAEVQGSMTPAAEPDHDLRNKLADELLDEEDPRRQRSLELNRKDGSVFSTPRASNWRSVTAPAAPHPQDPPTLQRRRAPQAPPNATIALPRRTTFKPCPCIAIQPLLQPTLSGGSAQYLKRLRQGTPAAPVPLHRKDAPPSSRRSGPQPWRTWQSQGRAPTYVSRVLRMTLLAPEIVEAILEGGSRRGCSWMIC